MNYDDKRHVRQQAIYCPHCQEVTEQGVWVQKGGEMVVFGKTITKKDIEGADCLACDNTDTIISKQAQEK